ncbi:MAG: metal-dependent hydrolase [Clostridiaceae bacterium]|nr:metal-dependent hydrolase [Clostridiaceae bacterium]
MKLQYLGHSAFYFEMGYIKALIDPYISEKVEDLEFDEKKITHIFITHGHGDHMGNAMDIAKESGAMVISNYEICMYLQGEDINVHPMHIGGRVELDFGTVKMTPALHGSGIETEDGMLYGGNPCGFVIEIEGQKLYHAGDTGLTMDMQLLEVESIDVALIPIGGNFTMDIIDAARAVRFIKPKVVIPMHYNTFPIIEVSTEEFVNKVGDIAQVKVLDIEEVYTF